MRPKMSSFEIIVTFHTAKLLMWKDAEDSEVDEREAWGFLLSDLTRHVANGMMQEYGWDYDATRDHIRASFLKNFDDKAGGVTGAFPDL